MVGQADNIEPHPLGHIGQVEDSERTVGPLRLYSGRPLSPHVHFPFVDVPRDRARSVTPLLFGCDTGDNVWQ
jgi:hypothetical protein